MHRRTFLVGLALLPLFGRRRFRSQVPQTTIQPEQPILADPIPPGFENKTSWQVEEKGLLKRHVLFANRDGSIWRIYVDGKFIMEVKPRPVMVRQR